MSRHEADWDADCAADGNYAIYERYDKYRTADANGLVYDQDYDHGRHAFRSAGAVSRDQQAAAWLEGFVTAMGMERGYGVAPGSYALPDDDYAVIAWNPYTEDGYHDPLEDDG